MGSGFARGTRVSDTPPARHKFMSDKLLKWIKQCLGKYKYVTHSYAENKAVMMTKKYGSLTTVYRCPSCNGYHLTTHARAKKS